MRVLAYTSPARGHLNPMMEALVELHRRGAEVHVRTLSSQMQTVRAAGLAGEPLDPAIEALVHDDHEARSQIEAGRRSFATFASRAPHDAPDFAAALETVRPDVSLVDVTCFGAKAVAEREGIAWAESRPFLLEEGAPGVPPFGLGLRPKGGTLGRFRDAALGRLLSDSFDKKTRLPVVNAGRRAAGLPELGLSDEWRHRAPLTLYWTAEPFEYKRSLPPGVAMVGPGLWDTQADASLELPEDERPLALVACSSEFQDDGAIATAALAGLRGHWRLAITTAGVDPAGLGDTGDALVARFLPHSPLLERASVVVCHGGMGITQKALAFGVPVCVVPWGRDQLDVAAHAVEAGAGTRLSRKRLSPQRLAKSVEATLACAPGAAAVKAGYEAAGGAARAAGLLEELSRKESSVRAQ